MFLTGKVITISVKNHAPMEYCGTIRRATGMMFECINFSWFISSFNFTSKLNISSPKGIMVHFAGSEELYFIRISTYFSDTFLVYFFMTDVFSYTL